MVAAIRRAMADPISLYRDQRCVEQFLSGKVCLTFAHSPGNFAIQGIYLNQNKGI